MTPSEPITFLRVEIENFRGFRDARQLELGSSAVVIAGPNGMGKTSFFDALQWLLVGSIERLGQWASRRSADYVVNQFASSESAAVGADLLIDGQMVHVRRTGRIGETLLEWSDESGTTRGQKAEKRLAKKLLPGGGVRLKDALSTSGLLEQDFVRALLEVDPKERYRHISTLLGLDDLDRFQTVVRQYSETRQGHAKEARGTHSRSDEALRRAQAELTQLQARLLDQADIQKGRAAAAARLSGLEALQFPDQLDADSRAVATLTQDARTVRETCRHLTDRVEGLHAQRERLAEFDPAELEAIREEQETIRPRREDLRVQRERLLEELSRETGRVSELVDLASRAIPLLGDRCPVCDQAIDPDHVEKHLRAIAEQDPEPLRTLREEAEAAKDVLSQLDRRADELSERRRVNESAKQQHELLERNERELAAEFERLVAAPSGFEIIWPERVGHAHLDTLRALERDADSASSALGELGLLLGSSGVAEQVERQHARVADLTKTADEQRERATVASRTAEEAKTLGDATTRAAAAVTQLRIEQLGPLVDDIFARLDPHPAFKRLQFDVDVYYKRGMADPLAVDEASEVTADPVLVFSSSQANVAALTYFLALSWATKTHALPFLLLDDPLQSMDDVNLLGLSDLFRHLRRRRQLLISTHEQRLSRLLERKLAARAGTESTRIVRFVGWDRRGPQVETEVLLPQETEMDRTVVASR